MAKILLVEDDNNLREIYEARLQAEGYEIVSAKDGEEALVIAKKEQPDLVIADVMMPRVSGFEMLDILRNTEGLKDVHVIMLTALGQAEDKTRADSLGADRYLVKSQVTLEDIVKATSDVLAGAPAGAVAAAGAVDSPAPTPQPAPTAPAAPLNQNAVPPAPAPAANVAPAPQGAPSQSPPATTNIPVAAAPPDNNNTSPVQNTSPPAPEPPQASTQPPQTSPAPVPEPSASNDSQLADAVNNLVAGTGGGAGTTTPPAAPAATPPALQQAAPAPSAPPAAPPQPTPPVPSAPQTQTAQPATAPPAPVSAPAPAAPPTQPAPQPPAPPPPTNNDTANGDTVTPAGRKTIQPLSSENTPAQPGLDELLAKEGHSMDEPPQQVQQAPPQPQSYAGAPHPPGHVISPGNANPGAPGDPNSISL